MANRLLDSFPQISKAEWLEKINSDLKGRPYDKLIKISESGIPISPVYTAEDLPLHVANSFSGMNDMRRGENYLPASKFGGWHICQDFTQSSLADFKAFSAEIVGGPDSGVAAIRLVLSYSLRHALAPKRENATASGLEIEQWSDLEPILDWAKTNNKRVFIQAGDASLEFLDSGLLNKFSGGLDFNPYAYHPSGEANESMLDSLLQFVASALPKLHADVDFRLITLDFQDLESAGANSVQQIAFALAMASDLVDRLAKFEITPSEIFQRIGFHFPISTDFFGEIAKIRAFRVLWSRLLEAWGLENHETKFTHIQSSPAISNATVADPHVNLLRNTTQAMAAAIGGCHMIGLSGFDAYFKQSPLDSLRTARNIQLILQKEAYLGNVADAAGGSYFVECLTDEMAEKAWALLQEIEARGGWFLYYQQDNFVQLLERNKQQKLSAIRSGAKTLLGTNQFANESEILPTASFPESKFILRSAIFQRTLRLGNAMGISNPIPFESRLGADFENIRRKIQQLAKENHGANHALLLTFGDLTMRAARANFARNVLAAGGFLCTENTYPTELESATALAKSVCPSVVVLCAADVDYFAEGTSWLEAIHTALPFATIVLAGKPDGWEKLREDGISSVIFAGMDRVAFLEVLSESIKMWKGAKL